MVILLFHSGLDRGDRFLQLANGLGEVVAGLLSALITLAVLHVLRDIVPVLFLLRLGAFQLAFQLFELIGDMAEDGLPGLSVHPVGASGYPLCDAAVPRSDLARQRRVDLPGGTDMLPLE